MSITIELLDERIFQPERQSAELYSWSETDCVAEVTFGNHLARVLVNGEMRIQDDDVPFRNCGRLAEIGVTDDASLNALLEREGVEVINNPWWEVIDPDWIDGEGIVCGTALEALNEAVKLVINKKDGE